MVVDTAKDLGEKLGLKSLGVTKDKFHQLHEVAENFRQDKREREDKEKYNQLVDIESKKKALIGVGNQFEQVNQQLMNQEQKTIKLADDRFLTIRKVNNINDMLMMAITPDGEKDLKNMEYETKAGQNNKFAGIQEWQIVKFFHDRPEIGFYWDKDALNKTDVYWSSAAMVRLGEFDNAPYDQIRQSFTDKGKLLPIPEAMLSK